MAESKMFEVAEDHVVDSTRPIDELLNLAMDQLEENFERGDTITGAATGYDDLDDLLSGLQPSTLNIVGARPAMGKTAFGLGLATHIAKHEEKPVLVFSLEMGHSELTQRILSSEAKVDSTKLRTGKLTESDWSKIGLAVGRLEVPLFLDDNPQVTVMEIRAKARRIKAQHGGLSLILIDYLQLMSGSGQSENRQLEVSEISRNLKVLARELEVPIVALSQLSRNLESRSDKRPMLADLPRIGLARAGRRRRDVPLPRRGVQPGVARQGVGRGHRRQAPLRSDRHQAAGVPRPVHPLRQRRPLHVVDVAVAGVRRR